MTTSRLASRVSRAVALLSIPALAFAISVTSADARPGQSNGNGHGNGHGGSYHNGHGGGYGHGGAYGYPRNHVTYVAPRRAPYRAYAPYRYAPYPAYAPYPVYGAGPVVRPYPIAPPPYGTVVYDPVRGVNGFIGFGGPNFSIGIGF
jgi:hypothetical protein